MIYFISDTHFYHENVIKYSKRPFNSIEDMNNYIVKKWNEVVSPNDTVYHLGDFSLGSDNENKEIFNRLNGNIILVRGNHDEKSAKYYENIGFIVLTHAPIVIDKYKIVLSHKPVPDGKIPIDYINIHGHIHNKKLNDEYDSRFYSGDKHINVSVDVTNYKPVSLDEIKCKVKD